MNIVNDITLGQGAATLGVRLDHGYCSFGYRIALTLGMGRMVQVIKEATCIDLC